MDFDVQICLNLLILVAIASCLFQSWAVVRYVLMLPVLRM